MSTERFPLQSTQLPMPNKSPKTWYVSYTVSSVAHGHRTLRATETFSGGQAFIERPGEVDQVVNTGTAPYVLFVTFPNLPQGVSPRTDEADPGTCPGV